MTEMFTFLQFYNRRVSTTHVLLDDSFMWFSVSHSHTLVTVAALSLSFVADSEVVTQELDTIDLTNTHPSMHCLQDIVQSVRNKFQRSSFTPEHCENTRSIFAHSASSDCWNAEVLNATQPTETNRYAGSQVMTHAFTRA